MKHAVSFNVSPRRPAAWKHEDVMAGAAFAFALIAGLLGLVRATGPAHAATITIAPARGAGRFSKKQAALRRGTCAQSEIRRN